MFTTVAVKDGKSMAGFHDVLSCTMFRMRVNDDILLFCLDKFKFLLFIRLD